MQDSPTALADGFTAQTMKSKLVKLRFFQFAVLLFLIAGAKLACADVGVLLNEPDGNGASRYTRAGHAAVYLSNICPASPVKLRLCEADEEGSIISNYSNLGEDKPYEWNIVPVSVFLYGVTNAADRPLYSSMPLQYLLAERYRQGHLQGVCRTPRCIAGLHEHWRSTVAVTMIRTAYLFAVYTTRQQDEKMVAEFNARINVNHYNGPFNNCANFAKRVIEIYFPRSIRPNYLNDFGMTSPKAVARSFSHYAVKHPELHFYVRRFTQMPSTMARSNNAREGTEVAFYLKKWLLPLAILHGYELPVFATTYALTGRFSPQRELAKYAIPEQGHPGGTAGRNLMLVSDVDREQLSKAMEAPQGSLQGSSEEWDAYRERFEDFRSEAEQDGLLPEGSDPEKIFRYFDRHGVPVLDEDGHAWLRVNDDGQQSAVGLSSATLLSGESDPKLAYRLMLARVGMTLAGKADQREMMPEFRKDWLLLEQARAQLAHPEINTAQTAEGDGSSLAGVPLSSPSE